MEIRNYTGTNTESLEEMQAVAQEIATEVDLAHSAKRSFDYLMSSKTPSAGLRHFKAVVQSYYRQKANQWLDENGYEALPPEFDEWDDIGGAARAHILRLAGIAVNLHNGFFTTDSNII